MISRTCEKIVKYLKSGTGLLMLALFLWTTSCKDEIIIQEDPVEQRFQADSEVANLMMRVAMKDGSADDFVDASSFVSLEFPFAVFANKEKIEIHKAEDYRKIESVLSAHEDDEDSIEIVFPVTVGLPNFSTITVSSYDQLRILSRSIEVRSESDPIITCLDIQYPVNFSYFNEVTKDVETYSIANDQELFEFLDSLENDSRVDLDFPITVILSDGTEIVLEDLLQLEATLKEFRDSCNDESLTKEEAVENGLVAICHGRNIGNAAEYETLYVEQSAVSAHLEHGDELGSCEGEEDEDDDDDDDDD
jgi:hypothetical protein